MLNDKTISVRLSNLFHNLGQNLEKQNFAWVYIYQYWFIPLIIFFNLIKIKATTRTNFQLMASS